MLSFVLGPTVLHRPTMATLFQNSVYPRRQCFKILMETIFQNTHGDNVSKYFWQHCLQIYSWKPSPKIRLLLLPSSVQGSFFSRIDALLGGLECVAIRSLVGGGVHDSYTFQCGLVGYFTSPGIDTRGTNAFTVSSERHWQSGVNGIAKVPMRKVFTEVGLEPSTVRSPVDGLTHSVTSPPHSWQQC